MKTRFDTSRWSAAAGAAALLLIATQAGAATIITANGTPWTDNLKINTLAGFGSNVTGPGNGHYTVSPGIAGITGTPDIALSFASGWDQYTNWNGRGNVMQVESGSAAQTVVFTPLASAAVHITSADFDLWTGAGNTSVTWTVTGAVSGTLASGVWTRPNSGGRELVNFNATGSLGEAVTLSLRQTAGDQTYFAIDNLSFDQVPEPSSMLLGLAGFGALVMRRRRA